MAIKKDRTHALWFDSYRPCGLPTPKGRGGGEERQKRAGELARFGVSQLKAGSRLTWHLGQPLWATLQLLRLSLILALPPEAFTEGHCSLTEF